MPATRTDDGVTISYRVQGNGPTDLLFMHGWAGSGAYFDETLKHLDLTGLRAISVDLRGHGQSDKIETGFTLDRFARDVLAVADHVRVAKMVVVGFSMSGKFAQYVPLLAPHRVVGQVLVAPCPASKLPFPGEIQRDWVSRVGNREKLREVTAMFTSQPVKPEVLDRWADDAARVPRVALDETLNMLTSDSFVDRLESVRIPTLVVGGIHDPILTPDALRESVVTPLAGARLVLVDSNHEVPIERPSELAGLIGAFLAGLSNAS